MTKFWPSMELAWKACDTLKPSASLRRLNRARWRSKFAAVWGAIKCKLIRYITVCFECVKKAHFLNYIFTLFCVYLYRSPDKSRSCNDLLQETGDGDSWTSSPGYLWPLAPSFSTCAWRLASSRRPHLGTNIYYSLNYTPLYPPPRLIYMFQFLLCLFLPLYIQTHTVL